MEAVAIVPSTTTYICGICMDDFPEEGVVKHCGGKHIYCRECFDSWVSTSTCNEIQEDDSIYSSIVEHYCNDPTTYHIPELIYKTKTQCPTCRGEIRLMDDGFDENYTGTITKNVHCYGGNYLIECSYLNGKKHGSYKRSLLSNGKVMATCEFVNGRIQDTYTAYEYMRLGNGRGKLYKLCEIPYVDGNIDGVARFWHNKDQMLGEKSYQSGLQHGEEKRWYQNGILKENSIYHLGNIVSSKEWLENGNPLLELNYNPLIKGQKHGVQKQWHCTGNIKAICHYNYGSKCGIYQKFDQGGNLVNEEDFGISEDPI